MCVIVLDVIPPLSKCHALQCLFKIMPQLFIISNGVLTEIHSLQTRNPG